MKWIKHIIGVAFALCVFFLRLLGKCLKLNYVQISVVFNLWIQGGILVLSAIMPLLQFYDHSYVRMNLAPSTIECFKCWGFHCVGVSFMNWILLLVFWLLYALIYVGLYIWMRHHYHLPWDKAFNRCVGDLEVLAREWHCSYQLVNLVIFVFLFLFIIGLNYILVQLIGLNMFIVRF